MIDRETLTREYQRMSDEQLRHFATHEASGLTPEALAVLWEVLNQRGAVRDSLAALDIQLRELSRDEFDLMVARFRRQPCPICSSSESPLNAVVVIRGRSSDVVVGCSPCLKSRLRESVKFSMLMSLLLPFLALKAQAHNDRQAQILDNGGESAELRKYVWENRGEMAHLLK